MAGTMRHKVTFQPVGVTVEVDPADPPGDEHGLPGSLLAIALARGVQIEHACGGVAACGTCHVVVEAGADNLCEPDEDELDTIDRVPDNVLASRLACKAVVHGDVTVRIPG